MYFHSRFKPDTRGKIVVGCMFAVLLAVVFPLVYEATAEGGLMFSREVGPGEYVLVTMVSALVGFVFGYGVGSIADGLHFIAHAAHRRWTRRESGRPTDRTDAAGEAEGREER